MNGLIRNGDAGGLRAGQLGDDASTNVVDVSDALQPCSRPGQPSGQRKEVAASNSALRGPSPRVSTSLIALLMSARSVTI